MRLAAIDTSTRWCGVALIDGSSPGIETAVVAEVGAVAVPSHGAMVLPLLESALAVVGWERDTIDVYAATRGPGSFTGLRIGLGTARGLALASGHPCIGVGTLDAFAEAYGPAPVDRVPVLDAGRGEVYAARFDPFSSPPRLLDPPWVGPLDLLLGRIAAPVVLFGAGVERRTTAVLAPGQTVARAPRGVAAAAGRLAFVARRDGAGDGSGMSPLYVRPPDAARPRNR